MPTIIIILRAKSDVCVKNRFSKVRTFSTTLTAMRNPNAMTNILRTMARRSQICKNVLRVCRRLVLIPKRRHHDVIRFVLIRLLRHSTGVPRAFVFCMFAGFFRSEYPETMARWQRYEIQGRNTQQLVRTPNDEQRFYS